jgi:hypothetical protein
MDLTENLEAVKAKVLSIKEVEASLKEEKALPKLMVA